MTTAYNPETGETRTFPNPGAVPGDWKEGQPPKPEGTNDSQVSPVPHGSTEPGEVNVRQDNTNRSDVFQDGGAFSDDGVVDEGDPATGGSDDGSTIPDPQKKQGMSGIMLAALGIGGLIALKALDII